MTTASASKGRAGRTRRSVKQTRSLSATVDCDEAVVEFQDHAVIEEGQHPFRVSRFRSSQPIWRPSAFAKAAAASSPGPGRRSPGPGHVVGSSRLRASRAVPGGQADRRGDFQRRSQRRAGGRSSALDQPLTASPTPTMSSAITQEQETSPPAWGCSPDRHRRTSPAGGRSGRANVVRHLVHVSDVPAPNDVADRQIEDDDGGDRRQPRPEPRQLANAAPVSGAAAGSTGASRPATRLSADVGVELVRRITTADRSRRRRSGTRPEPQQHAGEDQDRGPGLIAQSGHQPIGRLEHPIASQARAIEAPLQGLVGPGARSRQLPQSISMTSSAIAAIT